MTIEEAGGWITVLVGFLALVGYLENRTRSIKDDSSERTGKIAADAKDRFDKIDHALETARHEHRADNAQMKADHLREIALVREQIAILRDTMASLEEWRRKWDNMPDSMGDATKLNDVMRDQRDAYETLARDVAAIRDDQMSSKQIAEFMDRAEKFMADHDINPCD
jgi:hypothetical protein